MVLRSQGQMRANALLYSDGASSRSWLLPVYDLALELKETFLEKTILLIFLSFDQKKKKNVF